MNQKIPVYQGNNPSISQNKYQAWIHKPQTVVELGGYHFSTMLSYILTIWGVTPSYETMAY